MGVFIDFHAPGMFRLHIAPIRRSRPDEQPVAAVGLFVQQELHCPHQPLMDGAVTDFLPQIFPIAAFAHIFGHGLNQRRLVIRLHGILVCGKARRKFRKAVLVSVGILQVGLLNGNESVHDIPVFALKRKEHVEILANEGIGHHLHRQLDEGIVVANPDLAIGIAGIETAADQIPRQLFDPVEPLVISDFSSERPVGIATGAHHNARNQKRIPFCCHIPICFFMREASHAPAVRNCYPSPTAQSPQRGTIIRFF